MEFKGGGFGGFAIDEDLDLMAAPVMAAGGYFFEGVGFFQSY